jgi:hypothetical protein
MAVTAVKFAHYRIFITNEDSTVSTLYSKQGQCTTIKGRQQQLERVVNMVVEGIRDVKGWRRLTVETMTPEQVSACGLQ